MLKKTIFSLFLLLSCSVAFAENAAIKGKVQDSAGKPIPAITVSVLNTALITISDENGEFVFSEVKQTNPRIQFQGVGFATKVVSVNEVSQLVVTLDYSDNSLDEVVVTASKTEDNVRNLPAGITVLSGEQVNKRNIWNIKDLSGVVPSFYAANPGDNRNVVSVRGIANTSYSPAIGTYVDGVSQFNLDSYIPDLWDVERIEVVRGPQGLLYGRNAMGGVINIITKQPTNLTEGSVQWTSGNFGTHRGQVALRTPLVKDKVFFGVSGLVHKTDGFYTNTFNNSHYDKQNLTSGNAYLKYLPLHNLSATINLKQVYNRNNGAFPLVIGDAFENPYKLNQNAITKMVDNTTNASLNLNYSPGSVAIQSITAFQKNHRYYKDPIDADFSPLDAMSIINNYGKEWNKSETWTQEFRVSPTKNQEVSWAAGAFLYTSNSPTKQGTYYGADAGLLGSPMTDFMTISADKAKNEGLAFYGQAGYNLHKDLKLEVGLRYDYENYTLDSEASMILSPDQISSSSVRMKGNSNAFSPSASLRYTLDANTNLYGTYTRGFRPGGLSRDAALTDYFEFLPEYSNNFEVGSKSVFFNNRLSLNAAAYLIKVNNAQVPMLIMPLGLTVTQNTGELTSKGIEVEAQAVVTKNFRVGYTFAYTHARYDNLLMEDDETNTQFEGNRPLFTPDFTSNLTAQYEYPVSDDLKLNAGVDWRIIGKQFFDLKNQISQDSYGMLNARIGASYKKYSLSVWGQNLNDKKYIAYAYNFGGIHLGKPLSFGATLQVGF